MEFKIASKVNGIALSENGKDAILTLDNGIFNVAFADAIELKLGQVLDVAFTTRGDKK